MSHYLRARAYSRDANRSLKKVKLQLISDADMHLFFKKVLRGIVSYIYKTYRKASNKYLKSY